MINQLNQSDLKQLFHKDPRFPFSRSQTSTDRRHFSRRSVLLNKIPWYTFKSIISKLNSTRDPGAHQSNTPWQTQRVKPPARNWTPKTPGILTTTRGHASTSRGRVGVNCTRYQPGLPVNYLSADIKSGLRRACKRIAVRRSMYLLAGVIHQSTGRRQWIDIPRISSPLVQPSRYSGHAYYKRQSGISLCFIFIRSAITRGSHTARMQKSTPLCELGRSRAIFIRGKKRFVWIQRICSLCSTFRN